MFFELFFCFIYNFFNKQKFRLKKSGITNAIYLIEEFGSIKHMSLPEKSLIQADVNTQLIDNIIVHHTNDPKGISKRINYSLFNQTF